MSTVITMPVMSAENTREVEKTYEAEGYDLLMGTVEDFMEIIDIDKLGDKLEVAKMVMRGYDQIKPLIMDVFPELTAEEFKRVKVNDLINTIMLIGASVVENLDFLKSEKNVPRA